MVARWRGAAGTTIVAAMRRALLAALLLAGCARSGDAVFKKISVDAHVDAVVVPPPDASVDANLLPDAPVDAAPDAH